MIPCETRYDGIDGAVGILEHHGHLAAVREFRRAPADVVDRLTLEANDPRARPIHQRQQSGDGALAAPALAHQRDDLAPTDREAHVVHGVQELLGPERPASGKFASGQRPRAAGRSPSCSGAHSSVADVTNCRRRRRAASGSDGNRRAAVHHSIGRPARLPVSAVASRYSRQRTSDPPT